MNYFNFVKYIEINPTELCNLQCSFCPRAHGYPNQNLHMSLDTAREIKNQLDNLHFKGKVIFAGRGEPTLTKNFDEILDIFLENEPNYRVQVTTNGKKIDDLKSFLMMLGFVFHMIYTHLMNLKPIVLLKSIVNILIFY